MSETLHEIITKIDPSATLFLSNFTPPDHFQTLRQAGFTIKLLPSTLTGTIDTKRMKPFDPDEKATLLLYPLYQESSSEKALRAMQASHNFTLFVLHEEPAYVFQEIQKIYYEGLNASKDLHCGEITSSKMFTLFLAPHMFCPKDEIIESLKKAGVALDTTLKPLYQEPYFESVKKEHLTAHECRLGFIALDCDISEEEAKKNVAAIVESLDHHALRRCSF